jgi:hypothetical protein
VAEGGGRLAQALAVALGDFMEDLIREFGVMVLVGGIFAFIAYRFIRSGSIAGALLGGKIKREVGEILLEDGLFLSQTLKVHTMKSKSGETFVGVSLVSKAVLGAGIMPFKLSRSQARALIQLLDRAVS